MLNIVSKNLFNHCTWKACLCMIFVMPWNWISHYIRKQHATAITSKCRLNSIHSLSGESRAHKKSEEKQTIAILLHPLFSGRSFVSLYTWGEKMQGRKLSSHDFVTYDKFNNFLKLKARQTRFFSCSKA